jgi:hypothetical protein
LVVLIPKKENPTKVSNYSPISLSHNFAKTVTKLLANRLAPELEHHISVNQTAFIKKRCIHSNFVYVQQVIKDLHRKKVPSLFIKLDISKALTLSTGLTCFTLWNTWVLAKNGEIGFHLCGALPHPLSSLMGSQGKESITVGV